MPPLIEFTCDNFYAMAGRTLQMTGHDLFIATPESVDEYGQAMAKARQFPDTKKDGSSWEHKQVMPVVERDRVCSAKRDSNNSIDVIVNASKSAGFMRSTAFIPPLQRNAKLFSTRHRAHLISLTVSACLVRSFIKLCLVFRFRT